METGKRWAAHIAKITGMFAWGFGLLLYVQLTGSIFLVIYGILEGTQFVPPR